MIIALFLSTDSPQKLKLEKIHGTLIILFYVSPSSPQLQKLFIKNTKNNYSSASDCWEYTKYRFKENAKTLPKNSTTQQNITISRLLFLLKTQKTSSSASVWWGNIKSSFKCNARISSKSSTTQNLKKRL